MHFAFDLELQIGFKPKLNIGGKNLGWKRISIR